MNNNKEILNKGWAQMSQVLDRELPQDKERKPLLLWSMVASFLLLGLWGVSSFNPLNKATANKSNVSYVVAQIPSLEGRLIVNEAYPVFVGHTKNQPTIQRNIKHQAILDVVLPREFTISRPIQSVETHPKGSSQNKPLYAIVKPIEKLDGLLKNNTHTLEKKTVGGKTKVDLKPMFQGLGLMTGFLTTNAEEIQRISAGMFYNIGSKKWSTEIGISYDYKLGKGLFGDNKYSTDKHTHYFKLPILLNYKPTNKFYINTGIESYLSYAVDKSNEELSLAGFRVADQYLVNGGSNFGFVGIIGVGARVTKHIDVSLRYGYEVLRFNPIDASRHQASFNVKYYLKEFY